MEWRELTTEDFEGALNATEKDGYTLALHNGDLSDPLDRILTSIANEARGYIGANPNNQLDETEATVPEEVIHHLAAIARHRVMTRIGIPVGEDRKREYETALAFLRDIAAGKYRVTPPGGTTPQKASAATPGPQIYANDKQMSRAHQSGAL